MDLGVYKHDDGGADGRSGAGGFGDESSISDRRVTGWSVRPGRGWQGTIQSRLACDASDGDSRLALHRGCIVWSLVMMTGRRYTVDQVCRGVSVLGLTRLMPSLDPQSDG